MHSPPVAETRDDSLTTSSLAIDLHTTSSPNTPVEYNDTPTTLAITLTNTGDAPIEPGEAYLELPITAHAIATPPATTFASMDAPHTWELTEPLDPGETLESNLSLASDGLERDPWHGQLDIVANVGMEITDKKTVFIYG